MKHDNFFNVDDAPFFCGDVPDYRAEAFEDAKKMAKTFVIAFVMYNGLYYHVTSGETAVQLWKRKGYKVIHVEYSEAMKRQLAIN